MSAQYVYRLRYQPACSRTFLSLSDKNTLLERNNTLIFRSVHSVTIKIGLRQMPWFNDIASALGIPIGATTLALGIYAACRAAEGVARPEALTDLASILANSSWTDKFRPATFILNIFRLTFGRQHFSVNCFLRSLTATTIFSITVLCFIDEIDSLLFDRSPLFSWIFEFIPEPG